MRFARITLILACVLLPVLAQNVSDGPTSEKAQKTYKDALSKIKENGPAVALE